MDIVICTDNNYIMPSSVLLRSLEEYNSWESNTIHVISNQTLTQDSKDALQESIVNPKDRVCFYFFDINNIHIIANIGIHLEHLTIATFLKLYTHRVLPESIHRTLYLDGDTMVCDSLSELWNTDLKGKAVATVEDALSGHNCIQDTIIYDKSLGYFNAGVMLMNLDWWREHDVEHDFLDFAVNHPELCLCSDQDIFNFVFRQQKINLHPKFNVQYEHYRLPSILPANSNPLVYEALRHPYIVHFTWMVKPWKKWCNNPNAKTWRRWLKKTHFKGYKLQDRELGRRMKIKYFVNVILGLNIRSTFVKVNRLA